MQHIDEADNGFGLWKCSAADQIKLYQEDFEKRINIQNPDNPVKVVWIVWFLNKQGLDGFKGAKKLNQGVSIQLHFVLCLLMQ